MGFRRTLALTCGLMITALALTALWSISGSGGAEAAGAGGTVVSGRVTSVFGPVDKARVRVQGRDEYVLTDETGRFELEVKQAMPGQVRLTAGKQGLFNNGIIARPGQGKANIGLHPIYLDDDPNYRFNSPGLCARCHTKLTYYWDQSKMSRTTANAKVWEMYYGLEKDGNPQAGPAWRLDNPKDRGQCAFCHAPSAAANPGQSMDLQTILADGRTEWNGISCEYCHKIRKITEDPSHPSGYRAILERQVASRGRSIMVFGPYDDVVVPPMAASYNPVFQKGLFCATCHNHQVDTPGGRKWAHEKVYTEAEWASFKLADGAKMPVQTTFHEWRAWQESLAPDDPNKGKRCQQCHMSWQKKMLPYDNYVVDAMARNMWGTRRKPENIHPHVYEGGSETQLPNALSLEVEGEVVGDKLKVRVSLTNTNGGHWVPTGEPMRSMILVVEAADSEERPLVQAGGQVLPDWAGSANPGQGDYAGKAGRVLAKVLADDKGNLNVPFWRATRIESDTRIRPKTTEVYEYEFKLADPEDEPSVEARLIYRPVHMSLARAKKWLVADMPITSRAW